MGTPVDEKQMIKDAREFDLLYSGLRDSDDSGDEDIETLSLMKREMENRRENNASCSVLSTTVEHGEEKISSGVGCKQPVRERHTAQVEKIMKSVVGEDFKLESDPPDEVRKPETLREKMNKQESTKGDNWFIIHAPDVTEALKKELDVFKMGAVLIHKQLCKKNALETLPQYVQVGEVVESSTDIDGSHIHKKQKKQTMGEELLADSEFQRYNKQHFSKIIEEHKGARRCGNKK